MQGYDFKKWINLGLEKMNITKPTEIQKDVWSKALKNENIIGIAPTGTGKTLAFLIPILQRLDFQLGYQGLIICPTRELARQIYAKVNEFKPFNEQLKTALWIGGEDLNKQVNTVNNGAQIIVCTPTRFLEVYKIQPTINLKNLKTVVLDEADMLLDLGFFKEIDQIFTLLQNVNDLQKMSFSATIHNLLSQQLAKYLDNAKVINLAASLYNHEKIKNILVWTNDKFHALSVIANQISPYLCIIFANTKKQADEIFEFLKAQDRSVINLHAGLQTRERKNNYKDIKNLKYQYVVASDLASRGLDIEGASHVISWSLPNDPEWYIHRAGRTGRQKYEGISYILYNEEEKPNVLKLIKKGLVFENYTIKNNQLVKTNRRVRNNQPKVSQAQEKEIKEFILKAKKDVKPGYKKKMQAGINKIKQKHKREHLEKVIKEKRIAGYKTQKKKS